MSKVSHTSTSSSSSSVRRKLIDETTNRKALEAKLRLFKEKLELAKGKLQLHTIQEEEEFQRDIENVDGTSTVSCQGGRLC